MEAHHILERMKGADILTDSNAYNLGARVIPTLRNKFRNPATGALDDDKINKIAKGVIDAEAEGVSYKFAAAVQGSSGNLAEEINALNQKIQILWDGFGDPPQLSLSDVIIKSIQADL